MTSKRWADGERLIYTDLNALAAIADGAVQSTELDALAVSLSAIYTGTITLTQPTLNKVHQRTTRTGGLEGLGAGPVPLTISASFPIAALDYRVRNAASPTSVLIDWTSLDFERITGTQIVSPSVPAGLYAYLIDLRPNSDATKIVSTTNQVTVGEVVVIAGQSLALDMFSPVASGDTATIASSGLTVPTFGRVWAAYGTNTGAFPQVADSTETGYPPTAWALYADGTNFDSTFGPEFMNRLIAAADVPVGLVGYAVGGTGIDTWLPGYTGTGTAHYEKLAAIITAAGARFDTMIWFQGHYQSRSSDTGAAYLTKLGTLFDELTEDFPNAAGFKKLMCSIGGIGAYSGGAAGINATRATMLEYVESDDDAFYVDCLDATLDNDLVHQGQAGSILLGRHFYRAFMEAHGLSANSGRGPMITGASREFNSATITLAVENAGTAWVETGNAIDQFVVYNDAAPTTPVTISDLDLTDPDEIGIILASAPAEPASLKVWYRPSPDTSTIIGNALRDNVTDGDGISTGRQLALTGEAIVVAIPLAVMTVGTIADDTAGDTIPVAGTYSNALPTILEYSTDAGATWTTASTPTIGSGNYSFTIASLPVGVYRLRVRDATSLGYADSNVFTMSQASPETLPTVASMVFRLNAAAGQSHFYTDTGRTVQAVIGDAVRGVKDISTAGTNHFSQPVTAQAPLYQANQANGLPGLYFNAALDCVLDIVAGATLAATLKAASNYTMIVVFTPSQLPDNVAMTTFCASEGSRSGGLNLIRGVQGLTTGSSRTSRNGASGVNPTVASSWVGEQLTKAVVRYTGGSTLLQLKINALTEASATTNSLEANAFDEVTIGAERSVSVLQYHLDGHVHEIVIWAAAADDAKRTELVDYMTAQWGA